MDTWYCYACDGDVPITVYFGPLPTHCPVCGTPFEPLKDIDAVTELHPEEVEEPEWN